MVALTGNISTDILAIVVSLLVIAVAYVKWCHTYWKRKGITTLPTTFLFGNASDILLQKSDFGGHIRNTYKKIKPRNVKYCGYYFLLKPQLFICDLDLIKTIMTKDFIHFTDHSNYINEKVDPLSGHLFSLKGLKWKNLRAKLTPTFTSGKIKMMFQTLVNCSVQLIGVMDDTVERNEAVDIKEIVGRFTTDIIGSCAFGIDCNSLKNPNSEFREHSKILFKPTLIESVKNNLSVFLPEILDIFDIPLLNQEVSSFFMNMVKNTVDYREKNNVVRKDFMHLLIQIKNNVKITNDDVAEQLNNKVANETGPEAGKTLTIEELAAQAFVFFLAGFETSSTTLTFCFYELVSNLSIQDKLRKEINDVLDKHDGNLTYDAIMEMTYMDKCINETLRKYPPIPILVRECTQPFTIPNSNITLEKGAQVIIPVIGIHHDPDYYPDPEKFDPERFSQEIKSQRHTFAWLPFGEGPRACIGLRFGMMQTKVALAVLLKNYKFTLSSKTQIPIVMDVTAFILTVKGGVWLNAEKV